MPSAEAVAAAEMYAPLTDRSVETLARDLDVFVELLRKWQSAQNLVSRETLNQLWPRHIADSLQLLKRLTGGDRDVIDLGSGGGFPAIPLAIALRDRRGARFTLVESNARKISFLRTVIRELALPAVVDSTRIEQIDSRETFPDLLTARALAPLSTLFELSFSLFGPKTHALFHKGREHANELAESRGRWDFDVLMLRSDTSADGVLLDIRHLRRKSE